MSSAENDETRRLNSKYEYRNPKQIQSYNVLMTKTNTPSCILETKCRTIQFRSFGFWSFDIALRLPVIRIGLYNRPLRVVSLSNHFEFRISRSEYLCSSERSPLHPCGVYLKAPTTGRKVFISGSWIQGVPSPSFSTEYHQMGSQ